MRTWKLLLLALVPGAVGYGVNLLILLPGMGAAVFYLQGLTIAMFCVWLGMQCAKASLRFPSSLRMTQWPSVVSFSLYIWQFHFCGDETRNLFFAVLSQLPSEPLFFYAVKLVSPFSNHSWGPPETLAATGISLVLLTLLFTAGFWWRKCRTGRADSLP